MANALLASMFDTRPDILIGSFTNVANDNITLVATDEETGQQQVVVYLGAFDVEGIESLSDVTGVLNRIVAVGFRFNLDVSGIDVPFESFVERLEADGVAGGYELVFAGDDTIAASEENDFFSSGDGDDLVEAGGGSDTISGGAGNDVIVAPGNRADYEISIASGSAALGSTTLRFVTLDTNDVSFFSDFEEFRFADQVADLAGLAATGPTEDADNLVGTLFDDTINALGGDDTVVGVSGDDLLIGGGGNDVIRGARGDDSIRGNAGDDMLNGNGGADVLIGARGADTLAGNGGADAIRGGGGDDVIRGNGGADVLRGNGGADEILGGGGGDQVIGGGGADTGRGGGGSDTLLGGGGADRLFGDGGADVLQGQFGDDTLVGGGGADVFQFRGSDRADVIEDFLQGQDLIEILSGAQNFDQLSIVQDGLDVLITFGVAGQIRVLTDDAAAFDESDFIF